MSEPQPGRRELRSFGLIVGGGFAVIAMWPVLVRAEPPRTWALALALFLAGAALVLPGVLRRPFRGWMFVGETLGWINTRIILGLVYYLMIVPIGGLLRIAGRDPMRRRYEPDAQSYRIPRVKRPATHMQRQF